MKKIFTLAALGLLSAASMEAQAQITLDGKVSAAEIGTGTGKYQLAGTYTGTHSVANKGLQSVYIATSATKLYIMVVGSSESTDYPGFVVYLNVPGRTGVAAGTQLKGGAAGDSPLKHTPTMDMQTDYGFRATTAPTGDNNVYYSYVDYTNGNTAPVPDTYQGNSQKAGVPIVASATTGPVLGARFSYLSSASVTAAATAGSGLEMELDMAALGLTTGNAINVMAGYVKDGGAFTSDVIPQVVGQTADLGSSPNFSTLPGSQNVTYVVGTGVTATRNEVAQQLNFKVYPNPATAATTVSYKVLSANQEVELSVYNSLGQVVRTLAAEKQAVGTHTYKLPALAAGTYLVKLSVGADVTSSKIVVE
ncbi:Por secretion system C-terminal sorting domain-containing protein [Hymenobacter daecheongensis DSM 21074]|uniref:Por secretion system C-terminal sorting domain-containing protein n=1 Tax=Hymenobacter daecheongensis DSM 21074 TaxID=1121955 RepID=A0A1M6ERZ8_9BACT|nr:T9SS type A sorting domain-containing protein [Hymenobacter daecheongensis]SHI88216.1 Por secretion system C-terminal sorting domain-containing protein [Hymenobacter daecheongensis DSM 21074]